MWSDLIPIDVWKKTREQVIVCLEKEMGAVLTSAIAYSWRLSELTHHTGVKQLLKNKANVPHREAIWADNKPHAKNYCRVG